MEILVVDDSETVRIRFRKFFEEHGYEIYEAENQQINYTDEIFRN